MDDNLDEIKADCVFVRGLGWMDKSFFDATDDEQEDEE